MFSCEAIRESTPTAAAVFPTTPTHDPIDEVARASFKTRALPSSVSAPPKTGGRVEKIKQHSLTSTAAGIKTDPSSHPALAERLAKFKILDNIVEAIKENNIKKLDKLCRTHPEALHFCDINRNSLFTLTIRWFEENEWSAEILEILVKHDPKLKAPLQEYIFYRVSAGYYYSLNLPQFGLQLIEANLLDPYLLMCLLVRNHIRSSFSRELLDIYKWDKTQLLKDSLADCEFYKKCAASIYADLLNMPEEEVESVLRSLKSKPIAQITCTLM